LPFDTGQTAVTLAQTIAPGQSILLRTDGSGAALTTGWAELTAPATVNGTAIFTAQSTGRPPSEAAVPLSSSAGSRLYLPFGITPGFTIGLALANPNPQDATVSIALTDEAGQPVSGVSTIVVPAHGHFSDVLTNIASGLAGKRGVALFSSNVPLYGLGIRF